MGNSFDEEVTDNLYIIVNLSLWLVKNTRNPKHALHILDEVRRAMQASADLTPEQEAKIEAILTERNKPNVSKN